MVSYSEAEGEYHYVLIYSGDFVFENPENITVFIPLPSGSVDDLLIEVNEEEIRPITIKLNQVIIPLIPPKDRNRSMLATRLSARGTTPISYRRTYFLRDST